MSLVLNNFVGNALDCVGVAQHMLNVADEKQILVSCVDVIQRFRKFAFNFRAFNFKLVEV